VQQHELKKITEAKLQKETEPKDVCGYRRGVICWPINKEINSFTKGWGAGIK
jgi:hypothetical protein